MATIRDHVRGNLGETYKVLTEKGEYDGKDNSNPDVVGDKIAVVCSRYLTANAEPENMTEFVKSVIADIATRLLIPVAIDYYMVQTRLVDNMSRPAGVTPLGGEVGQNYNRVAALQALDTILRDRIAEEWSDFQNVTGATGVGFGVRVTAPSDFRTEDPADMPPVGGWRWWGQPYSPGFGVIAIDRSAP